MLRTRTSLVLALVLAASGWSVGASAQETPPWMLWVWHGPQDLRGLPPSIGVAYLARTLRVQADGTAVALPRRAPLHLDDATTRWAVMRIELERGVTLAAFERARETLIASARTASREPRVRALQIDFDAPRSLRPAYAELLSSIRRELAPGQRLSITALGSWCVSDRWLSDAHADLAVPMLFGPGHDLELVERVLASERALPEPRCRHAIGVREPLPGTEPPGRAGARTLFVFPRGPWTLARALALLR